MMRQTFQIATDNICALAVLNWSSPSLVSSENQRAQAALAGHLINSHGGVSGSCIGMRSCLVDFRARLLRGGCVDRAVAVERIGVDHLSSQQPPCGR